VCQCRYRVVGGLGRKVRSPAEDVIEAISLPSTKTQHDPRACRYGRRFEAKFFIFDERTDRLFEQFRCGLPCVIDRPMSKYLMNERLTPEKIRQLSVAERLRLIEDVWASLSETPERIQVPDWHRAEVDTRLAAHERDPEAAQPWADVKADILRKLRK